MSSNFFDGFGGMEDFVDGLEEDLEFSLNISPNIEPDAPSDFMSVMSEEPEDEEEEADKLLFAQAAAEEQEDEKKKEEAKQKEQILDFPDKPNDFPVPEFKTQDASSDTVGPSFGNTETLASEEPENTQKDESEEQPEDTGFKTEFVFPDDEEEYRSADNVKTTGGGTFDEYSEYSEFVTSKRRGRGMKQEDTMGSTEENMQENIQEDKQENIQENIERSIPYAASSQAEAEEYTPINEPEEDYGGFSAGYQADGSMYIPTPDRTPERTAKQNYSSPAFPSDESDEDEENWFTKLVNKMGKKVAAAATLLILLFIVVLILAIPNMTKKTTKNKEKAETTEETVDSNEKAFMDLFGVTEGSTEAASDTGSEQYDSAYDKAYSSVSDAESSRFETLDDLTFYISSNTNSILADEKVVETSYKNGEISYDEFMNLMNGYIEDMDELNHLLISNKETYSGENKGDVYDELLDDVNTVIMYGDAVVYNNGK